MKTAFLFPSAVSADIRAFEAIVDHRYSFVISREGEPKVSSFKACIGEYQHEETIVSVDRKVSDPEILVTQEWLSLLESDAGRYENIGLSIQKLRGEAKVSEVLADSYFKKVDCIVCWGNSVAPALLYAQTRFVVCCTDDVRGLLVGADDSAALFRYAIHVASAVVVFSKAMAELVKETTGVSALVIGNDELESLSTKLLSHSHNAITAFDSLKQKRCEITYEARYGNIYDAKYHDAICYQMMDEYLVDIIQDALVTVRQGNKVVRVLDLGCGPGSMVSQLSRIESMEYYGVDISATMIEEGRKRFPMLNFTVGDAENLNFTDGYFDLVLCSGMLHHFPNVDLVLGEVNRVLSKEGCFVCREPNERNFSSLRPELGFLHLCLKNIIHVVNGTTAITEPEEHDYHTDFDYENMPDIFGKFFRVEGLFTNQKVSYFYDMLLDEKYRDSLARLESTLDGYPGLNIVVVGKKVEEGGVSLSVKETTSRLGTFANQNLIEHLFALKRLYLDLAADKDIPLFRMNPLKISSLRESMNIQSSAQVGSQSGTELDSSLEDLDSVVDKFDRSYDMGETPDFEELRCYDHVRVLCKGKVDAKAIVAATERCRDYGLIEIVVAEDTLITNLTERYKSSLNGLSPIEVGVDQADGNCQKYKRFFMSRSLFSRKNFLSAFQLVLNERFSGDERVSDLNGWIANEQETLSAEYEVRQMMGDFYEFLDRQGTVQ